MAWFRRKTTGGRHALGAAVTSIPSGPPNVPMALALPVAAPVTPATPAAPVPEPNLMTSIAQLLATGEAWDEPVRAVGAPRTAAAAAQPTALPITAAPRVQLGFRDGTTTALDPASSQSLALEQLAQSLTRRA